MGTMTKTMKQYIKRNNIRVEVTRDRGAQADPDGWEHHAYVLRLVWDDGAQSRFMDDIPWRQGYGIETTPDEEPATVLDALVSDANAYDQARSFEDFCNEFGYDTDSRRAAEAMYLACGETLKKLVTFLGGRDEYEQLAYDVERI